MLGIWMFGVELERMWGTQFFLRYYAITGVGAAITTIVVVAAAVRGRRRRPTAPNTVGASGALYGILLAFALYYPDRPILMFLLFPVPAKYFVMIIGAISFLLGDRRRADVAHAAHLGGMVFGYLYLKGGRRRAHRGNQVPLPEVEDEPAAPQVRRVLGRPIRLGPQGPLTPGGNGQAWKYQIGVIQPVLADRAEQVQLERVVERLGLVLDPGRDVQHFPFAHGDFLAVDQELERALQHVGHLLALVRVHRHERSLLQVDLRQHLALAGDDLAGDHLGDLFERDFVPAMQSNGGA